MKSELKGFLMTLAATTVSIVLTFGTTAIVDRKKQNAEKREMVMMIMYDMRETLKTAHKCKEDMESFFDVQIDLLSNQNKYPRDYALLAVYIPEFEFTSTTENIFRSNIETIRTIGNILFVENVSMFYDYREQLKNEVIDPFKEKAAHVIYSYDSLLNFDSSSSPFLCSSYIKRMEVCFEQCRQMMKVKEEELEVFSAQQQKLHDATEESHAEESTKAIGEWQQRRSRYEQVREQAAHGQKNK